MKYLVESPEGTPLLDPFSGDHIAPLRPSVVHVTPYLKTLIEDKQVKVLDELTDEADDDVFQTAYRDDQAKALAALPRVKPAPAAAAKK